MKTNANDMPTPEEVHTFLASPEAFRAYVERRLVKAVQPVIDAKEYFMMWGEWPQWYIDFCKENDIDPL